MRQIHGFYRSRLGQMIGLRKTLAALATHIPWQELEASVARRYARQAPSVTIDVRSVDLEI